jgi:hypothetical protein
MMDTPAIPNNTVVCMVPMACQDLLVIQAVCVDLEIIPVICIDLQAIKAVCMASLAIKAVRTVLADIMVVCREQVALDTQTVCIDLLATQKECRDQGNLVVCMNLAVCTDLLVVRTDKVNMVACMNQPVCLAHMDQIR